MAANLDFKDYSEFSLLWSVQESPHIIFYIFEGKDATCNLQFKLFFDKPIMVFTEFKS